MILHLRVDNAHKLRLVILQNVSDIIVICQIRLEVFHHLPSELIELVGVISIAHVVKIDEAADEIILQSLLRTTSSPLIRR